MHVNSSYASYGMYSAEARSRFFYLPMPGTTYYTPWLWIDGDYSAGSSYSNWENLILQRIAVPSPLTARMWGEYNPSTRSGTINVMFISDSNATLSGRVLFVITEDSIQRSTPNGDLWHNHVARDYIPDHIGTAVTLNYQDSVTVSFPFTISSSWVDYRCEIVAMIQDPVVVNVTKRIWQGAKIKLMDLNIIGIEEQTNNIFSSKSITVRPNPCVAKTQFSINLPIGENYRIKIFDIGGKLVKTLDGITTKDNEHVLCDFMNAGVYFYAFESKHLSKTGKIIVK
ncbi:MAG: Omp28-related outer membrane protein [candidate division WOR-3 bacterium]